VVGTPLLLGKTSGKVLATTVAAFWLTACGEKLAQDTCAATADPEFATMDDAAARATIADTLTRGDITCAGSLLRVRHEALAGRNERAATIERLALRDLALFTLRDSRFPAEQRLALVLAGATPPGIQNSTVADSRAASKLLKLAAVQLLNEQAYGVWLDAFAAWLRVSPRSDSDVSPLLPGYENDEPFVAAWKSGASEKVLELTRQVAHEPNLENLRKTIGRMYFNTDECRDGREAPSAAMVVQCRQHLRLLREIEAIGCCALHPGATSEMTFEAAIVILRAGDTVEGSAAVEQAIAMLNALPPKDRWSPIERIAARLQRVGYDRARITALRQEAEALRRIQYRSSPPAR
jgi:hypothetical protein